MYEFFKALASPYVLIHAVLGAALFIAWRRAESNRGAVRVALISWLTLIAMSNRCVSHALSATLERHYAIVTDFQADIDAIVVLAGGIRLPGGLRERAVLSTKSMRRCVHAAELYHRTGPFPLILCGGKVDPGSPGPAEAEVMRDFFVAAGVAAEHLVLESNSRTTYENARNAADLIKERGFHRVAVVTHGRHMYRSLLCFRRFGIDAAASPCHLASEALPGRWYQFVLPNVSSLVGVQVVMYEWTGVAWYKLSGKL